MASAETVRKLGGARRTQKERTVSPMATSAPLIDQLCHAAAAAKLAYETAYEAAQSRGGSELMEIARGVESATIAEVALHAITQCEWVIEQCRGCTSQPDSKSRATPAAAERAPSKPSDDAMPDWLVSAAQQLEPETPAQDAQQPAAIESSTRAPARSESFNRRRRRTRKTGD